MRRFRDEDEEDLDYYAKKRGGVYHRKMKRIKNALRTRNIDDLLDEDDDYDYK